MNIKHLFNTFIRQKAFEPTIPPLGRSVVFKSETLKKYVRIIAVVKGSKGKRKSRIKCRSFDLKDSLHFTDHYILSVLLHSNISLN